MDKLLNEPKNSEALERRLRQIEIQIFKRELARRIEAAQPESAELQQEQPLQTE